MGLGLVSFLKSIFFVIEPSFKYIAISFFIYLAYHAILKKDKPCCIVLALLCALIFDEYMDIGFGVPGVEFASIKYSEMALLFGIITFKRPLGSTSPIKNKIVSLFIIFSIFFAISVVRSSISSEGFNEGLYAFRYEIIDKFLFFIFISSGFENQKDYKRVLLLFAVYIVLVNVPTFQMYLHGWDYNLFPSSERQIDYIVRKHSQHAGRFGGYFLVSNRSGVFCATVLPLLLSVLLACSDKKARYLFGVAGLVGGVALFSSGSRSAMLGVFAGLIVLSLLHRESAYKKFKYGFVAFLILIILAPTLYSRVSERLSTLKNPTEDVSANQRLILYDMTTNIILDNLTFGIGYGEGNFKEKVAAYGGIEGVHDNPHNSYLQIAVMLGFPALIVFLLIIASFITSSVRLNQDQLFVKKRELHSINTGIISGMVALLVSIFFNPILFVHSISSTMWVLIGLGVSMRQLPLDADKI